jgi:hypothetical protein
MANECSGEKIKKQKWDDYYKAKREESFKTWFSLVLFECVIKGRDIYQISGEEFIAYPLASDTKDLYIHEYYQLEEDCTIKGCDLTIKKIYEEMRPWFSENKSEKVKETWANLSKAYWGRFETNFSEEKFRALCEKDVCHYCGITIADINVLIAKNQIYKKHHARGWTLEIDRRRPNDEYTEKNSVRCCYWCNNAKTDEFTDEEFQPIADQMRKVWVDRLKKFNF